MAISGMEHRNMPLVSSLSFWKPWGPGRLTPGDYLEHDDDGEMEQVDPLIVHKRRHSWAGYNTYMQAAVMAGTNVEFCTELLHTPNAKRPTSTSESNVSPDAEAIATGPDTVKIEPATADGLKHGLDYSTAAQQSQANAILPKRKKDPPKKKDSRSTSSDLVGGVQLLDSVCSPGNKCSPGGSPPPEGGGLPGTIGPFTTLMIRNLPYWLKQAEFLAEVDRCGYASLYDFCYMPHKFAKRKNLGFAFLNFHSSGHASQFRQDWHNSRRFGTAALNISAAAVQGRDENIKMVKSKKFSIVRNPGFRPAIFDN